MTNAERDTIAIKAIERLGYVTIIRREGKDVLGSTSATRATCDRLTQNGKLDCDFFRDDLDQVVTIYAIPGTLRIPAYAKFRAFASELEAA
ncbi:MAG: hypothetical protein ACK5PJ_04520 [Ralstonia sp.]|jgi:hypothetical protein